jgi:hypothetical protein
MGNTRNQWIRPQLIVLGRGTPEENVLAGCKTSMLTGRTAMVNSCKKQSSKTSCGGTKCSVISKTS